jgi:hypothetical protein
MEEENEIVSHNIVNNSYRKRSYNIDSVMITDVDGEDDPQNYSIRDKEIVDYKSDNTLDPINVTNAKKRTLKVNFNLEEDSPNICQDDEKPNISEVKGAKRVTSVSRVRIIINFLNL